MRVKLDLDETASMLELNVFVMEEIEQLRLTLLIINAAPTNC